MPLLPRGAGDSAAHPLGLPALGISAPDMDAMGAAGGQGATGGLAGMRESHGPDATCSGGHGRRRPSGAAAIQAVRHVPRCAVGPPRGGGGGEAWQRRGLHGVWPSAGSGPGFTQGYMWEQPADGPLRPAPARDPLQLPQGAMAGWPWERGFAEALVCWASALQWVPGSGQVTYAELALDFESHSNRALPARPGHRHPRQVLSLRERA